MLIDRIPEWHLTAQDDAEITDLLARCFATDFGGRSFFTHHHHLRLVIREGRIIGHMALLLRSVQLGERRLTVAGLAEVATDPAHRGKGIAAALLQEAIAEAKASPAEYLLLFGTANLYVAAGFTPVSNPLAHLTATRRLVTKGRDHLMVLPLRHQPWPEGELLDLRGPVF